MSNSAEYYMNHIKYYYNKIPLDKIFIHNYILYGDYSKTEVFIIIIIFIILDVGIYY